jgi:hypothetical protein
MAFYDYLGKAKIKLIAKMLKEPLIKWPNLVSINVRDGLNAKAQT